MTVADLSVKPRRYNRESEVPEKPESPRANRLESWKEIAAYLSRSERTVRRWETTEALPVHRLQHDKRGSVYAYTTELDDWRTSRSQLLKQDEQSDRSAERTRLTLSSWRGMLLVAVAIVGVAGLAWTGIGNREPGSRPRTSNSEALRAYRQAAFNHNAGRIQIQTGIQYLQEAIRLDPRFADAWAGLATAHVAQTWFSEAAARQTLADARREAEHALRLDRAHSGAHRVLAAVHHFLDWDHRSAEKRFLEALELHPASPVASSWFAEFLLNLGRFDEARTVVARAREADPRWLETMIVSGNVHAFSGHARLAIAEYERALAIEPNFGLAHHFLGRALLLDSNQADHLKAITHLRKANDLLGQVPFSQGDLGYGLAVAGFREEAERLLVDLVRRYQQGTMPAFPMAAVNAGLGRIDDALEWLERATDDRHLGYYFPSVDPVYASLRTHPRFQAVLRKLNVEPTG